MARRLVVLALLGLAAAATPALGGGNLGRQKASLDAQLAAVQAKIASTRARASALNGQIGSLDGRIGKLESRVGDVSTKLSALETDLRLRQRRLKTLDALYSNQTARLGALREEYSLAVLRLDDRLVSIYQQPQPGTIQLVLQASSFQDVMDEINYLGLVANEDETIAAQVKTAKQAVVIARKRTAAVRIQVHHQANLLDARVQQAAILRGELLSSKGKLADARAGKAHQLVITKRQEDGEIKESQAIAAASAAIEAKLQAADGTDASAAATATAAGFIWPVQGPITSPFGPRWGTIHPGIDIGVPDGTPIHAAAAGTVVYCGWEEGYGNFVVIDHHNGLATAYGHQSRIAVSCNENVAQGQVIGYSGCTGYCTGPHLHFEVRVDGKPVDPIPYLP
jgi:murein DD-endopeptidase MepM/ murein hydrolase activator NlpD